MSTIKGIRPFYCGSQSCEWMGENCFNCARGNIGDGWDIVTDPCPIQLALDDAFMGDGEVSMDIWRRCGGEEAFEGDKFPYLWLCPARETEEEKKQRQHREWLAKYEKYQIPLDLQVRQRPGVA